MNKSPVESVARPILHERVRRGSGCLHARLINRRYPWADLDGLRAATVEAIADAAKARLRPPPLGV